MSAEVSELSQQFRLMQRKHLQSIYLLLIYVIFCILLIYLYLSFFIQSLYVINNNNIIIIMLYQNCKEEKHQQTAANQASLMSLKCTHAYAFTIIHFIIYIFICVNWICFTFIIFCYFIHFITLFFSFLSTLFSPYYLSSFFLFSLSSPSPSLSLSYIYFFISLFLYFFLSFFIYLFTYLLHLYILSLSRHGSACSVVSCGHSHTRPAPSFVCQNRLSALRVSLALLLAEVLLHPRPCCLWLLLLLHLPRPRDCRLYYGVCERKKKRKNEWMKRKEWRCFGIICFILFIVYIFIWFYFHLFFNLNY